MRHQGREVALIALYALDGVPSFERPDALRRLWTIFDYKDTWDALFTPPPANPHPLDNPPLWGALDALPLTPATTQIDELPAPIPSTHQFAQQMLVGVLHHLDSIDPAIADASKGWRIQRMAQVDRNILRIGAYEILFCDDVPDPVAINEAIELSKQYASPKAPSFINGVLDRIRKNKKHRSTPVVFHRK